MNSKRIQQYHLHKEQPGKLQFDIHSLGEYVKKNEKHACVPHSHSFYQILWFFKKSGNHFVDFNEYPILDNTVFFIAKNQVHYFEPNHEYEGIGIHFNENFFMQSDVDVFLKYNVFNRQGGPCYCITPSLITQVESYINLIKIELKDTIQFGHREVIRYLLKSLLIVFERAHRESKTETIQLTSNYELTYLHFRELLEKYYTENYTVQKFADLLNISPKTLTTITNAIVLKSPSILISERIILEAKRLLSFTPLQINEVAYKLGFIDASYFIKYFKRHTKYSPGDYRKLSVN